MAKRKIVDGVTLSDFKQYVEERKTRDPEFKEALEDELAYEEFKKQALSGYPAFTKTSEDELYTYSHEEFKKKTLRKNPAVRAEYYKLAFETILEQVETAVDKSSEDGLYALQDELDKIVAEAKRHIGDD